MVKIVIRKRIYGVYEFHVGDCRGRKRPRNDREREEIELREYTSSM